MWGAGGGFVGFSDPHPVWMAVSVKHKPLHWVPSLSTKTSVSSVSVSAAPLSSSNNALVTLTQRPQLSFLSSSASSANPPFINFAKVNSPPPQLALLSLGYVLSATIGAIFSLAIISIPTMMAFKKLGVSVEKLSKVVSEEVPGTLSSLKLSVLEINELTRQLTNLRQKISGTSFADKSRSNKPTFTTSISND
ncbi:uncharacterized protein LOC123209983 [Mangifera indica]|uniref:uncharacterized protein LOC123209983 n=1 Tax=Mangifera indica TaxID=29780 RepID=UPI001CFA5853|nr:uncharacterized protein LOC123209983 [Mangifera indica]